MPIQIGNTDINQLINDSRIGMGNQFNPIEAIYSGGAGMLSAYGVHPNVSGCSYMATTIEAVLP